MCEDVNIILTSFVEISEFFENLEQSSFLNSFSISVCAMLLKEKV